MQLEEFLEHSASRSPDKLALVVGDQRMTYRELDAQANALAHSLIQLGIRRGDRVVVCLHNSVASVLSIFGILKAGGVFVVLGSGVKLDRLLYKLGNSRAIALIVSPRRLGEVCGAAPRLEHLKTIIVAGPLPEERFPASLNIVSFEKCVAEGDRSCHPPKQNIDTDLAALIYTSASTGSSKGVMLTHLNMVTAATSITTYLENREDDVILNVLPLSFDYGLYQVLMGSKVGATVILEKSFAYPHGMLEKISKERVTGFPIVPTIAAMLLEMDLDTYYFSSLRYVTNTGAALPTDHIRRLCERFPQAKLFSMYGLTECKRVSYLPPDQLATRPTSVGRGMPNQEVYLVDSDGNRIGRGSVGELVVRGSHVMKGYWGMPEDTAHVLKPGPWGDERVLHTGDWFHMDEEGYLYFVGRKDDMIKTGGRKVSPREVENVLQNMEEIAEAAVISQPDARLGQIVKAVVRLRHGKTIAPQEIIQYCTPRLEDFMVPRVVDIVPVLPKTESGKVDKKALAQPHAPLPGMQASVGQALRVEQVVARTMESYRQKTAVIYQGQHWSYGELRRAVDVKKSRLEEAGFSRMDRAIVWMENSPDYVAMYLAVLELGGIVVALHQQTMREEVDRIIRHVGAAALIVSPTIRQWAIGDFESAGLRFLLAGDDVHRMHYRDSGFKPPEGSAQIIYTSGSTGRPKGVVLTHKNLIANTRSILEYLQLTAADSVMAVLPFVYAYGNSVMLTHLFVGGTLVIENNMLYPHVMLDGMIKTGVTGFSGVSSTYAIILNQSNLKSYAFPALRYLTHAGGPMPSELLGRIRSAFSNPRIFLMYGQTEASARLTYLPPDLLDVKKGSAGRAIPGVTLRIVKEGGETARPGEVGEVCAYGDNIMHGYWQDPELTAGVLHEGWLHTGDLGRLDEEGFLTIEGRNNEMIKSGAYRISPTEIEEVLLQHPQIHEAGVVGIDDPILGQRICAVVTLKEPETVTNQDLMAYCAQRLVQYKRPRVIAVIPALPKSPSGKVLRQQLRQIGMSHSPVTAPASL